MSCVKNRQIWIKHFNENLYKMWNFYFRFYMEISENCKNKKGVGWGAVQA